MKVLVLAVLSLLLLACEAIDRPNKGHMLSAAEVGEAVREERDSLLSRLTEGTILYEKYEHINPGALEGYSAHTIDQSWTIMDDGGSIGAVVLQRHDLDGRLLHNSIQTVDPASYVFADLEIAFYAWTTEEYPMWSLANMWFMPLRVEKEGYPVKGSGYLNGRPSTIFEHTETEPRSYRMEIELVNDSPLLHRMSIYDESGLTSQLTLLEYRVVGENEQGS